MVINHIWPIIVNEKKSVKLQPLKKVNGPKNGLKQQKFQQNAKNHQKSGSIMKRARSSFQNIAGPAERDVICQQLNSQNCD